MAGHEKPLRPYERGGSWDRLQRTLHEIKRLRTIHGGSSWFSITFVAMGHNIHELPLIVRMAHDFHLTLVLVQDYQPIGQDYDRHSLRNDAVRANRTIVESKQLAGELGVWLVTPPPYAEGVPSPVESRLRKFLKAGRFLPKPGRFPNRCRQPWSSVRITADGTVTPCCFSTRKMGDLSRQTFEEVWNGWRYRLFRWSIDTVLPPAECRHCHVYEGINQGNPGNVMREEGRLVKLAYFLELRASTWVGKIKNLFRKRLQEREGLSYFRGKRFAPRS